MWNTTGSQSGKRHRPFLMLVMTKTKTKTLCGDLGRYVLDSVNTLLNDTYFEGKITNKTSKVDY